MPPAVWVDGVPETARRYLSVLPGTVARPKGGHSMLQLRGYRHGPCSD